MNQALKAAAVLSLWFLTTIPVGADRNDVPILIDAKLPRYPRIAEAAHLKGEVQAEFRLSADGDVSDVKTLTGHPLLQSAAQANIQSWKFFPRKTSRHSVTLKTTFDYEFDIGCVDDALRDQTETITLKSFRHIEIRVVPPCPES